MLEHSSIPSFVATKGLLNCSLGPITKVAFTPILLFPATEYDTIHMCILNFRDVLKQKSFQYVPLWCDEGVYCIAKELQLLNPAKYNNIFLGLGGFHLEKVVIACIGKYLEQSGIDSVLIENEKMVQFPLSLF